MYDLKEAIVTLRRLFLLVLVLVCLIGATKSLEMVNEELDSANGELTTEEKWTLASEKADEYTVYIDGDKASEDFDAFGVNQYKYFIRVDKNNKKIYLNKKTFLERIVP